MSKTYDTSEMRRAASMVRESRAAISAESERSLFWMLDDIPDRIAGEAAEALQNKARDYSAKIGLFNEKLEGIAAALELLAAKLDEADREAETLIRSK